YASLLERLGGGEEESAGQGSDMFAQMALREQAKQSQALAQLSWLGQVRGAQALCLDCPVPAGGARLEKHGNWLLKLATVLGIG
ncbi:MAG: hypothetical protein RL299_891, partial [Pseudomonadota bacterium]